MGEERFDVIAAAVGRIETTVTSTAMRVEAMEARLSNVERDVATIARRIEHHETRIEDARSAMIDRPMFNTHRMEVITGVARRRQ